MTPNQWFQFRFGCAALSGMAVVLAVSLVFYFHQPVLALVVVIAVVLVRLSGPRRSKMKLMVSPGGIGWVHPERGPGMIVWRDVAALIVRQAGAQKEIAFYLVPRTDAQSRYTEAFMMTTGDLGLPAAEGEERLKEFAAEILPRLPADLVVDRETRRWLDSWGLNPPGGGRNVAS